MGDKDKEFRQIQKTFEKLDRMVRNSERSAQFDRATIETATLEMKELVEKATRIGDEATVIVNEEEAKTREIEHQATMANRASAKALAQLIKRGKKTRTRRGDALPSDEEG